MNVEFLLGRANTGKSAAIREALAAHQRAGERAIFIVPEQYTFEAERALSERLGGLLGVQVLSFARLNERVLALQGHDRPFLSPQGHCMVIRRSAIRLADSLQVFSRSADYLGFAADMQDVFSNLKRAGITPEQLNTFTQALPENASLREKLTDIALLYQDTETFLASRYLTMDDAANTARALLPDSFIKGVPVYIDGIDRPSGQLYQWLGALIATASQVTITLRCDPSGPRDADLFYPDETLYHTLRAMAERMGASVAVTVMNGPGKTVAPAIAYLEKNLFAPRSATYKGPAQAISVFGASDRVNEVESLADEILSHAHAGVRYREMAVIVSDPESYMPLIARVFALRGIPVFLDQKHPLTGHAAIDAVRAAVSAAEGSFGVSDVLRLVKSGYAGVNQDDGEELELYLLRTGLKGSALTKPFSRGEVPQGAERARVAVMEPLMRLQKGLATGHVSKKIRALYAYLLDIGLEATLKAQAERLYGAGRVTLMEEHAQVWNALMEIFDQLDAIMGDVAVSRKLFSQLLSEGLSNCEIGVVPSTSDQVLLGDLARTKSRSVKCLFLVGVNDGLLPIARNDDGLIDERELRVLKRTGMPVWASVREQAASDRLELYTALSKATQNLFVSYCFCADGSEMAPSSLVQDILTLFPNCKIRTDLESANALPSCERAGLRQLTRDLSAFHTESILAPRLPTLLAYYQHSPVYAPRVARMVSAGKTRFSLPPLNGDLAAALYGKRIPMSASRLEQFSACPFKHFIRYGLNAADRQEYTERAADYGMFYHAALESFVRTIIHRKLDWQTITVADADAIMDDLLPEIIAQHNNGIFLHNERLRATLFLVIAAAKQSVRAILRQIQTGGFTPIGAELRFGEGQPFPPIVLRLPDGTEALLGGIIDRVDALQAMGANRETPPLRVIDYKLGGRDFDFSGILHGLTLQLPLYLAAATQSNQNTPAGMYYMPLSAPVPDEGEDLEKAAAKAFRLRGLTLDDPVILYGDKAAKAMVDSDGSLEELPLPEDSLAGNVCSRTDMERTLALAKQVSEQALSRMLEGHIEASPADGACKYCDYRSVCRFDPMQRGCRTRKYPKMRQEAFFALLGGEPDALDE